MLLGQAADKDGGQFPLPRFEDTENMHDVAPLIGDPKGRKPDYGLRGLPKVREPDLSQAKGTLSLNLNQLVVNGGTVKVPIYGEMTPLDLPKIAIGDVEAKINFQKGMGTIEKFQAKGADLDLIASGTLRLSKRLEYSEPNVDVKLKLDSDFTKRLGIVAAGLSTLPEDRENPGFRVAKLTGFLGKPNFNPGR